MGFPTKITGRVRGKHSSEAFVKKAGRAGFSWQAMHEKPQEGGKPLLVTMADRQPGEKGKGLGKGKEKGGRSTETLPPRAPRVWMCLHSGLFKTRLFLPPDCGCVSWILLKRGSKRVNSMIHGPFAPSVGRAVVPCR